MKKILIAFAVLFLIQNINAQYKTFVFGKYKYETDCHYNKADFITIKIKLQSLDRYPVELIIGTAKQYNNFISRLNYIKTKMIEWDSTCIQNNIDQIDKMLEYKVGKKEEPSVWFGKYYNSSPLLCAYDWENGASKIILHTGSISALTNEYIKCKGGVLIFNSSQDIDEMINAFDLNRMQNYINEKNKKADLLK